MTQRNRALLVLADGRAFPGYAVGRIGEAIGEVVFNTSMMGYQEILTDPSYAGQIVTMTYPLIGNYGINAEDIEARRIHLRGFVVREASGTPSNWRGGMTLDAYLRDAGVVGIEGIDTRALTKHIREAGAQMGVISTEDLDAASLARKAAAAPPLEGRDLVREVTTDAPYTWNEETWTREGGYGKGNRRGRYRVVAYDYGIKLNILRNLISAGCRVEVVPAGTPAADVLAKKPDGVFLSNGPGDPAAVDYAIDIARELLGKVPIFGICLGHQILCLALGGTTYKLKYGHHGGNQPVMDLTTEKVEITAQNHGFAVDLKSMGGDMECTHLNLNDRTVEGMAHKKLPVFSVQYHPEASPGPHDAQYLFARFVEMMKANKSKK
ncbi:MAG: glutamine-hydrolyzing carbamoyl-phosphate synthase small subunit [Candidatus Lernaella stagnicola]|nr:glutamine-hydrolyzing carbamoyl-phosphate synthase small subunit [Candidatus Lernaella stagnicola]